MSSVLASRRRDIRLRTNVHLLTSSNTASRKTSVVLRRVQILATHHSKVISLAVLNGSCAGTWSRLHWDHMLVASLLDGHNGQAGWFLHVVEQHVGHVEVGCKGYPSCLGEDFKPAGEGSSLLLLVVVVRAVHLGAGFAIGARLGSVVVWVQLLLFPTVRVGTPVLMRTALAIRLD